MVRQLENPRKQVLGTLSLGLLCDPDFEVLKPVIVSDAVLVMDVLKGQKLAPQVLFHDQSMLKNGSAVVSDFDVSIGFPKASSTLFVGHASLSADFAAIRNAGAALAGRATKGLAAVLAQHVNGHSLRLGFPLASCRAKASAVKMRCFGAERGTALRAYHVGESFWAWLSRASAFVKASLAAKVRGFQPLFGNVKGSATDLARLGGSVSAGVLGVHEAIIPQDIIPFQLNVRY